MIFVELRDEEQGTHAVAAVRRLVVDVEARAADVVDDPDGEVLAGLRLAQCAEDRPYHGGRELLGGQPVAPADDARHAPAASGAFGQRRHHVLVQRLADGSGLLGAVQYRDVRRALGQRGEERGCRKRPV
jgi:hypothetical protein